MAWFEEQGTLEEILEKHTPFGEGARDMPLYVPAQYVEKLLEAYRKLKEEIDDWEMKWEAMHDY